MTAADEGQLRQKYIELFTEHKMALNAAYFNDSALSRRSAHRFIDDSAPVLCILPLPGKLPDNLHLVCRQAAFIDRERRRSHRQVRGKASFAEISADRKAVRRPAAVPAAARVTSARGRILDGRLISELLPTLGRIVPLAKAAERLVPYLP